MNFWEAQKRARSRTKVYLFIFITLTLFTAFIAEMIFRHFMQGPYEQGPPFLGFSLLVVIFLVAFFQYSIFKRHGGSYVAESIGAKRVDPHTTDPHEIQLLNIVQEIAIASSLPVPPIYIIPAKEINAFAAGITPDKAAVAISYGALQRLNRDEIQGVIAHEFGHIYNGDMKISLHLAAMVMGFFFALYLGLRMLQFSAMAGRRQQKGGNPMALIALIFLFAGIFTWFAGKILKACVSREREYLADACAVQFTRNPKGIAGALRKILKEQYRDMPRAGMTYTHMYFEDHTFLSGLFRTHPPLKKRIAAIEGNLYTNEELNEYFDKVRMGKS